MNENGSQSTCENCFHECDQKMKNQVQEIANKKLMQIYEKLHLAGLLWQI